MTRAGSEERLAARLRSRVGELLQVVSVVADERGRILVADGPFEEVFGGDAGARVGRPLGSLFPDRLRPLVEKRLRHLLDRSEEVRREASRPLEIHGRRADGSEFPVEVDLVRLDEEGGDDGVLVVALCRDVGSLQRTRGALASSSRFLSTLLDNLPGMAYRCRNDRSWTMEYVSDGCYELTGYTPLELVDNRRLAYGDLIFPADRERVWDEVQAAVAEDRPFRISYRIRTAAAREKWVWEQGRRVPSATGDHVLEGFVTDVSESRRLAEQLRETEKMGALGRLASGVAHDFNNLLTGIRGYASFLDAHLAGEPEGRADLSKLQELVERAAVLTRQLLAFGRREEQKRESVDPATLVEGALPLLQQLLPESIELVVDGEPPTTSFLGDPRRLELVLLNLLVNARDAMPDGGTARLRCCAVDADAAFRRRHPGARSHRYVALEVSDEGTGMDESTRERIFEPFFTTKGPGQGTGLGLATVQAIVDEHDGHIEVKSAPQRGTTFRVLLPVTESVATAEEEPARTGELRLGAGRILLVEDEAAVRSIATRALRHAGYDVVETDDPGEAERLFADSEPDLLLTDIVLPGITGKELYERLRTRAPALRVLYMSGYPLDALARRGMLEPGEAAIQKPFSLATLTAEVRSLIEDPPGS